MGYEHAEGGGIVFYWPTARVSVGMTPREAWDAWLHEKITAEDFGRIIATWSR